MNSLFCSRLVMVVPMLFAMASARAGAATLLWKTDFAPAQSTLAAPVLADRTSGWQDIMALNPATGVSSAISPASWGATRSGFDMIADAAITRATLGDYVSNAIQRVIGPTGVLVYALFQNVKINNAGPPTGGDSQDAFILQRDSVASGDTNDVGDLYYTYWFKFQPDLRTQLGTGAAGDDNWRVLTEFKTGGLKVHGLPTWKGDYRIIIHVCQDRLGNLSWVTKADSEANGGLAYQVYWEVRTTTVPVPVGEWFKVEVFWHRSNGSDGRYWAAINGHAIVDHGGANMGACNLPVSRIMLSNDYSGGRSPAQQWITGLEIWDGFPAASNVPTWSAGVRTGGLPAVSTTNAGKRFK